MLKSATPLKINNDSTAGFKRKNLYSKKQTLHCITKEKSTRNEVYNKAIKKPSLGGFCCRGRVRTFTRQLAKVQKKKKPLSLLKLVVDPSR
jgi:hypothetical protein